MKKTSGESTAGRGKGSGSRYNIRAVERAIKALDLLSGGKAWKLSDLSQELGISTSSGFRLMATLAAHNYVEKDQASGGYRLGLACIELARAFSGTHDIRRIAMPELVKLRDETKETVHLAVLDEMEVVYLDKQHGLHAIGLMSSRIGGRAPAHCTGLGKVLLAFQDPEVVRAHYQDQPLRVYTQRTIDSLEGLDGHLSQVRERGYALDLGEHENEVRCIAAPIFDSSGGVAAAISMSGPASRLGDLDDHEALIERTNQAAAWISRRLGYPMEGRSPSPAVGIAREQEDTAA